MSKILINHRSNGYDSQAEAIAISAKKLSNKGKNNDISGKVGVKEDFKSSPKNDSRLGYTPSNLLVLKSKKSKL